MGNLVGDVTIVLIICVHQGTITLAKLCSSKNSTVTGSRNERCNESVTLQDDEYFQNKGDHPEEFSGIASHTLYTIVVVLGVVLIPVVVLTRICWLKKLQRQRNNAINEVRQIVDQRFLEEQRRRREVYSIDLSNIPYEDLFEKPPSYEESLSNPCTGCPPPYELPPGYKQNESDENDNLTSDRIGEQDQVYANTNG